MTEPSLIRFDLHIILPDRDDEDADDLVVLGHLIPGTVVSGLLGGWRIAAPGAVIVQARHDRAAQARRLWLRLIPGCGAEPTTTLAAKVS